MCGAENSEAGASSVRLGVTMVSRVLSGKRKLTLEHAKKLATQFGISPALFID
ncbi:TPA: helix-turn-helix domain-containing protein [Escherichia coli]